MGTSSETGSTTSTAFLSAVDAADLVRRRAVSPVELVQQTLAEIDRLEPTLHAFVTVDHEGALRAAREAERALAAGEALGPLHGVPVAVKDLEMTKGLLSTSGATAYRHHVPDEDSILVERLRAAGAIIVGKTNTPAFGLLGETKNRLGPPTGNPWDPARTTGGSSGGSAASVAAGLVPVGTGTDSAGSINCPSGLCGVFGIKPSHGRVPMIPNAGDSLLFNDGGPLTRTVADAALVLSVLAGPDRRDPVARRDVPPDYLAAARRPLPPVRVAFSVDMGHFAVDPEVRAAVVMGARRMAELVGTVTDVDPPVPNPWDIYTPLYVTDMRLSLSEFVAEHPEDVYPDTFAELASVPSLSAEQYVESYHRLLQFRSTMADFFETYEILLTPTTAVAAFHHDTPPSQIGGRPVPAGWTGFMPFQITWNMTGQPAANLPVGFTRDGLPVGMLAVAPLGREDLLLSVCAAYEHAFGWADRRPSIHAG